MEDNLMIKVSISKTVQEHQFEPYKIEMEATCLTSDPDSLTEELTNLRQQVELAVKQALEDRAAERQKVESPRRRRQYTDA